ncbi:hypothetical protein [Marininema halotolerans]|uniref:Uncharacterized protein n=1 Tax=Marininema halotolerans TaxID=1155944 RepID=A0A1I6R9D0_9BACL|nr:hypothetical protein [Marininema halotolerans]SFS61256.1 hypothetical protein SAMN05444972_104291 [Marininema halotolerans]
MSPAVSADVFRSNSKRFLPNQTLTFTTVGNRQGVRVNRNRAGEINALITTRPGTYQIDWIVQSISSSPVVVELNINRGAIAYRYAEDKNDIDQLIGLNFVKLRKGSIIRLINRGQRALTVTAQAPGTIRSLLRIHRL